MRVGQVTSINLGTSSLLDELYLIIIIMIILFIEKTGLKNSIFKPLTRNSIWAIIKKCNVNF